jgi:hypothetical protein
MTTYRVVQWATGDIGSRSLRAVIEHPDLELVGPLLLTSIQRRLDPFVIDEFADLSERNSPELLFQLMGFGDDPTKFDQRRWAQTRIPSVRRCGSSARRSACRSTRSRRRATWPWPPTTSTSRPGRCARAASPRSG